MAIGTTLKIGFDGKAVQRGLSSIGDSVANLGSRLGKIGLASVAAGVTASVAGFVAFAKSSSDAAAELEGMTTAFTVLTGSAEKAQSLLEEIRQFGATTPLESDDLIKAAQTLMAFGVNLEEVMPTLRMLGDVSMGSAEKLGSLALVFGQVSSAGKLTGQDLLQFINVGFNPLNQIAKRTGESMSALKEKMSDGKITIEMVKQAFMDATGTGGLFEGMLNKMADTTQGKLSNLSDNITQLKVSFGKGFNEGLNAAVDALNTRLPQMLESMKLFGSRIGAAISDAVNGNYDKFIAIGKLIGDTIASAAIAAFQAGSSGIVTNTENFLRSGIRNTLVPDFAQGAAEKILPNIQGGSFQELFDAQMILRGVAKQVKDITAGTQGLVPGTDGRYRFAAPNEPTSLRDANGNRVVEVLNKIERNTQGGAKM